MNPAVSFVIPSYSQSAWAEECFRSLQAQTFTDWEAVIVDDCSPDIANLRRVLDSLADPRFRLLVQERNQGPSAARNRGIREARGQWIACVDCDDKISPEFLETFLPALQADPELWGVFGDFYRFGQTQPRRVSTRVPSERDTLITQTLHACGILMRRGLIEAAGWYDENLRAREDSELFIRMFTGGFKIQRLDVALYHYRIHHSLNNSSRRIEHEFREYIHGKHHERYERLGVRRHFLGDGYRDTALASLFDGKRSRAVRFAWKSAWTGRRWPHVQALLWCLLPLPSAAVVKVRRRWMAFWRELRRSR